MCGTGTDARDYCTGVLMGSDGGAADPRTDRNNEHRRLDKNRPDCKIAVCLWHARISEIG